MKLCFVVALLVAAANAAYLNTEQQRIIAVPVQTKTVSIVKALNEADEDGGFNYNFESDDDIKVEVTGVQRQVGPKAEDVGTASRGSYSYTAPDGQLISLSWTADENGFRPVGSHLPVAPPMPDYVVKMLADMKLQEKATTQQVYVTEVKQAPTQQVHYIQQEVKQAPAPQMFVQEVKAAPAPQYTYVQQQEVKQAPQMIVQEVVKAPAQQQYTYVQEVKQTAPQMIVQEVAKAPAQQQYTYVQQEVKAAPAQQYAYVQQEVKAAPAPVQMVLKTEEVPSTQQVYVIETPASTRTQQVYTTTMTEDVPSVVRTAAKSSNSRQIFRVTFPESAN